MEYMGYFWRWGRLDVPQPPKLAHATRRTSEKSLDRLGLVAKVLGVIAAVFSVIFGFNQLTSLVSSERERSRHVAELLSVADAEQRAGDYPSSWSHLEEAAKLSDGTGIIAQFVGNAEKNRAIVRFRQEDLAMAWLENVRLSPNQKFADIVNQVGPVLELGATKSAGARKGDM